MPSPNSSSPAFREIRQFLIRSGSVEKSGLPALPHSILDDFTTAVTVTCEIKRGRAAFFTAAYIHESRGSGSYMFSCYLLPGQYVCI